MVENNKDMQPASSEEELVLVLDGIYSELAQDINAAKSAIVNELKYTAVQSQSVEKDLTEKLNEQIEFCENALPDVVEGTMPGEYKAGTLKSMNNLIAKYKNLQQYH